MSRDRSCAKVLHFDGTGLCLTTAFYRTPPGKSTDEGRQVLGDYRGTVVVDGCAVHDDPCIPLDNNAAERVLRGPVVGRKSH